MNIAKKLKKLGIEPIKPLNFSETYNIAKKIIELLSNAFPGYEIKNDEILRKMFKSKIYFANISSSLGKASYFYRNSVIYIDKRVNIEDLDEYVIHEIIHYLGENKDYKGKLTKIGICNFKEFEISGFAINEAAIQYITSKMLNKKEEIIDFFGMEIKTISKNYYPLLSILIKQIIHIIGEKSLLDGVIKSDNKFEEEINKYYGFEEYNQIQKKFDNILEIKQKLKTAIEEGNDIQKEQLIIKLKEKFLSTQRYLYMQYFNYYLEILDNINEIEKIKKDLEEYEGIIQLTEGIEEYNIYKEKFLNKLNRKSIDIYRKNTENNLAIINNNKILNFFKQIKNIFTKNKYKKETNKY